MPADRDVLEQVAQIVVPSGAVVSHLGTGGFASTFKVRQEDGNDYALKIVDAAQSGQERTDRELAALQRVNHPNVVGYLDTGEATFGGVAYRWLKMNFIDGETLGTRFKTDERFDLPNAVSLLRQAVAGAAALWSEQTAHRDLSPNNLMLTPTGELVIVDLGMARAIDDVTITTLPTPGTPGWMSPEQVRATPTHGDWRSDQFVLGLIAYRLVTGTLPFIARTAFEAWNAPEVQRLRAPRDVDRSIPYALSELILKMTNKQPHRRYLRPAALLVELDQIAASLVVAAPESTLVCSFILSIGDKKSFAAEAGYLASLDVDGLLIEPRSRERVSDFMRLSTSQTTERMVDPCTYLSRSPALVRPAYFKQLPFGQVDLTSGFASAGARTAYCTSVLEYQLAYEPQNIVSPYFYAGTNEDSWVREGLSCAATTRELLEARAPARGGEIEPVWTPIAVAQSWMIQPDARDRLMTTLTAEQSETILLLIHTTQPTFAPLGDRAVLIGIIDFLGVMREAGVPVVLGRRASEGLLGLAFGASGWATGVAGVQMNMAPHPETSESGGPGYDRIYVPQLLTHVTTQTYVQFSASESALVELSTPEAIQLMSMNPTLESLTTAQRVLVLQHNIRAMREQAAALADLRPADRVPDLRRRVLQAQETFAALPLPGGPGESSSFLTSWQSVLA